jgi:hypothetical protein
VPTLCLRPTGQEGRVTGHEDVVRKSGFYPVTDPLTPDDMETLRLTITTGLGYRNFVKALWTGEKRAPRKGEWYLSGAVVEAYRAKGDMQTPYHIARLVKVRTVTVVVIDDS